MSRILPSQAAAAIDALFPELSRPRAAAEPPPNFNRARSRHVAGALAVLAEVPSELLQLTGAELARLAIARADAEKFIEAATAGHIGAIVAGDVLVTILELLRRCPDQAVPAATNELNFILDPAIRESLRVDIAEVDRAISDGEWKSATVICGSVIEALLLWRLSQNVATVQDSAARQNLRNAAAPLERWDLHEFIEVAADLRVLQAADTIPQLRLAKDFRNLIHPGRALRLGRKCDQPTALAAAAGLGFLIRDLS